MRRHSLVRSVFLAPVAAIVATAIASAEARAQRPDVAAFDAYVARAVTAWGVPGLAIAIVSGDSVLFAKGYGVRTLGRPESVDIHTRFSIGSTTKAMTALALLMAADSGRVSLDAPVQRYLPTLQLYDPVMTRELTVRDLLTHHTGLPGSDQLWYGTDASTDEIIRRMRWLRPATSFRNGYAYQNVQYAMAGDVVRAATGREWSDFLRARVWEPLGMHETLPTLAATAGQPNVAAPHLVIDDTLRVIENRSVDAVAAAGSVWSSVSDMARWMRFVLDSGRVAGRRLVSEPRFIDWLAPQSIVPLAAFYPTAPQAGVHRVTYGLGWFLHSYAGDDVAMHTGSIDGMSAIIGLLPARRTGVYVLANRDHAELRHALMYRAFDLMAGRSARDWSEELRTLYEGIEVRSRQAQAAMVASRVPATQPSLPLERYVGTFADSLNGTVQVSLRDGGLRAAWGSGFTGPLQHWHYDSFLARWDDRRSAPAPVSFVLDVAGRVAELRVGQATFRRVASRN